MKQHISTFRMMLVVILLVGLFAFVGVASSHSPETAGPDAALAPDAPTSLLFSYQGQLLDTNGDPITDPDVDMTFKLYDVAELGTACWTEDHTDGDAVDVEDGLFNVLLGQITSMDTGCLAGDVYLELVVEGEVMSPRELLTSVAHAVEASNVSPGSIGTDELADGAVTTSKVTIDAPLNMNRQQLRYGIVWPPSYDTRGSRSILPGFMDTLYYATKRDIDVQSNRALSGGDLSSMFNIRNGSVAAWNDVEPSNPVEVTITYPGTFYLSGVFVAFGYRNSHAIDYTIEYFEDGDNDSVYTWTTIATVTDNSRYEVYHATNVWRVKSIRITVTEAGDGSEEQILKIATIQAPSALGGKATGPMMSVGGDTMYGDLFLEGTESDLVADGKVHAIGELWSDSNLSIYGQALIGQPDTGEGGQITLRAGSSGNAWIIDNRYGVFRLNHDNENFMSVQSDGDLWASGDVKVGNYLRLAGTDFIMEEYAGRGGGRAMVNDNNDILTINYDNDFTGGIRLRGTVQCGALVESNLQTIDEQNAESIDRFEEGDVLCWGIDQLELCSSSNDRLVQAVADPQGRPIVIGAELVKVIGHVLRGDILVSSGVPGYAMVNNDPKPGTVIAQALEDFDGEQGVIKAMIRKW